ncbi:MAG: hypothetical protein QNI97_14335 [Desulfobacterales bacterium]|nr:hypothetical protein [Desulfobacterales bacterium]MDJ0989618.1 hypothetical protein [Desulfobacterales bacterium]
MNKKYMFLIFIAVGTSALSFIFVYFGKTPKLIIGLGSIIFIMIWALWNPPEKHKEFSDRDRLQATSRSMGGSPPPEL